MNAPAATILQHCQPLAERTDLRLADLVALAKAIPLADAELDALARPDPSRPYGRNVLLATSCIEVMVATWTPGVPCAPHDHGGSVGVVRVLRGASRHQIWVVRDGGLHVCQEHLAHGGEVLACGPDFVHSMTSVDAQVPMMTLHIYAAAIPYMIVYDEVVGDTLVVGGGCGAWVPSDHLLLARYPGLLERTAVSSRWAAQSASDPADG